MDKIKESIKEKIKINLEYLGLLNNNITLQYYEKLYENIILYILNLFLNFIKNIIFLIIKFLNKILLLIYYINENDVLKNIKSNVITSNDKK